MQFLTNINTMLTDALGPLGPLMALGGLGLLLILGALPTMLKKKSNPFQRVKDLRDAAMPVPKSTGGELRRGEKVDKLQKFANFLEPQDAETMSASRLKMLRAGYKAKNSVRMFHFAQFALGIGALLLGMLYTLYVSRGQELSTQFMIIATVGPGAAGYYLPQYWVQRRLQARREEIVS